MNISSLFNTTSENNLSALVLRTTTGITLAAHGAQKLFAWFGGYGLEGTGQWMASVGIEPGYLMAGMAGSAEFFGGLALAIGLLTRPAAVVCAFTMLVALFVVHFSNGFFLSGNGFEYALVLSAACISIALQGPGQWSVDRYLEKAL